MQDFVCHDGKRFGEGTWTVSEPFEGSLTHKYMFINIYMYALSNEVDAIIFFSTNTAVWSAVLADIPGSNHGIVSCP